MFRYFQFKANCNICGKNLDLFSFRGRQMLKDGWLCMNCYKKAKDFTTINFKTPLERIKNIINSIDGKNKVIKPETTFIAKDKVNNTVAKTNSIIFKDEFKIVGTTFENHPKNLKEIVKNGLAIDEFEKYEGYTNKEILEDELNVGEVHDQSLGDAKLEIYEFDGKEAIKVLIDNFKGQFLEVGNIPKDKISKIIPYIKDGKKILIWPTILGGKFKNGEEDELIIETLDYGVKLLIKVYEK